ncbi:conserved hypothetical protein [Gloeothece citriformis PCC 7424]|uniref:DUF3854 domain-containing protein n=1 Tax=Gloeothece citriformis (strain PCC 7424) TaxID=65393 RepID=B7KGD0_GLOC7|nr:plasmid replication protein, CyRepA1 family [Gloeothece citriformis]ACK70601.1 conserved hypothetical protein [Gloeothece citriformis PCC 7424]
MNYLLEWQNSCVDEELIRLNVSALDGDTPKEYLLYSDNLPRRNDGRVSHYLLKRYQHTQEGGWWCSGVNLLTGEDDLWGCFKPNVPRYSLDQKKLIKYEHPPQTPTGLFALRVPQHLWQGIADKSKIDTIPQDINESQEDLGFWQWFMKHPTIPLCITEGAKKAGAILSAGYAAIALPGVHNGYRTPRDEGGQRIGKSHLIPQLKQLATPGREIYIVFDQDTKPSTIKVVNGAIRQLGYLLTQAGCTVKIITWNPNQGKGVDDLIANGGQKAFDLAYQKAQSLEIWKAQQLFQLTYPPSLEINSRYIDTISIPKTAKLIGIKSAKGTGKTQFLEKIVKEAISRQQWVLVIGHRVKLVEELCHRFGLKYISQVREDEAGQKLGYGLCIDSLHPNSQAQFNALDWTNGVVIIDEVEQVLWHGLNSDTCKSNRVAILKSLKTLMQNVLGGEGQVYIADADLSDTSLDYLLALAGVNLEPYVIQNNWKPTDQEAWKVYHYKETTPKKLVKDLVKHIQQGGKPFVCLSAQKLTSQWGTLTLEAYLNKLFPDLKILRLDSESLADPHHPAYNCITRLNEVLGYYDIVLSSPSLETGISIDLKGHFTSVWGIAQGVQTSTSVCQGLSRIRENIPRYIWVANYGFNQIGNGSTSIPSLLTSGQRLTQLNIRLLQQADFESIEDFDTGFQAESLLCWAKMAVRVNASMMNYREAILATLQQENHQLMKGVSSPKESSKSLTKTSPKNSNSFNELTEAINEVRQQNYQAECEAIAQTKDLSEQDYLSLKKRLNKTTTQRRLLRKYELKKRYSIPVTSQLIIKDDRGWYQQLRLHYFLTIGRPFLADRDTMVAKKLLEIGHGSLFLPDFNGSQLGAMIGIMEVLGVPVLLGDPQRELRNLDEDLKAIADLALSNRKEIKTVMGIGIAKTASPVTIIRQFLDKIGYSLTCIRCDSFEKKRVRVYQVVVPHDGREEVFKQWLLADHKYPGSSELGFEDYESLIGLNAQIEKNCSTKYVQLSLF